MADESKSKSEERREAIMAEATATPDEPTKSEGSIYSFPEHGVTVRAKNREDAEKQLEAKLKKESHDE